MTWWAALWARWRSRRLAREARRRRELMGAVSPRWLETHVYASGQGRGEE